MIDIGGGHQVWTKKVGSAPIKVLLLHGGPGADHPYFRSFQLEVRSELGQGTTVTMRIPLQTRLEVVARSLKTMAPAVTPLKQRHS